MTGQLTGLVSVGVHGNIMFNGEWTQYYISDTPFCMTICGIVWSSSVNIDVR